MMTSPQHQRPPPQFMIRIEFMCRNGLENMGLTARATITFLEVKEQIQLAINVPAAQQHLCLWRSEALVTYVEDDQKLSDYNIDYTSLLVGTYSQADCLLGTCAGLGYYEA